MRIRELFFDREGIPADRAFVTVVGLWLIVTALGGIAGYFGGEGASEFFDFNEETRDGAQTTGIFAGVVLVQILMYLAMRIAYTLGLHLGRDER